LLFWGFGLFAGQDAAAQNIADIQLNENFQNAPFKEFVSVLQEKYEVQVYYKDEWLDTLTLSKNFINTPLIQALNNVFLESNLTFNFFQDNSIVILPRSSDTRSRFDVSSQVMIIGNPLNAGKFKNATLQ
jgi:hypothetical protein